MINIGFNVKQIDSKGTRTVLVDADRTVFSAAKAVFEVFRGTEGAVSIDAITDARAHRFGKPHVEGSFYAGFYDGVDRIYADANSNVQGYMQWKIFPALYCWSFSCRGFGIDVYLLKGGR